MNVPISKKVILGLNKSNKTLNDIQARLAASVACMSLASRFFSKI
jgi:hypothetical protein